MAYGSSLPKFLSSDLLIRPVLETAYEVIHGNSRYRKILSADWGMMRPVRLDVKQIHIELGVGST